MKVSRDSPTCVAEVPTAKPYKSPLIRYKIQKIKSSRPYIKLLSIGKIQRKKTVRQLIGNVKPKSTFNEDITLFIIDTGDKEHTISDKDLFKNHLIPQIYKKHLAAQKAFLEKDNQGELSGWGWIVP